MNKNPLNMSNKTYDVLKYVAQVFLPALGVLVAALGPVWDLPRTDDWVTTIVAADAFLGALLLVNQVQYARKQPAEVEGNDAGQ